MKCIICCNSCFGTIANKKDIRFQCYGYNKKVVKCLACGLVFLTPTWTEEELNKLYSNYLSHEKDFIGQKRKSTISPYLTKYLKKNQIVLEVGHGRGDNVKFLRSLGYCVDGIDKDSTYCDNFHLFNIDYKKHQCCVDFVYAIQVFEHISDPYDFIEKITEFLLPNGKFLLEIPNLDDPLLKLYNVKRFKKFYFYPYHVFFYTADTVSFLLKKMGLKFKVKLVQKYGLLNHLRWILFGKPSNKNFHIPIIDDIYKFILVHVFKVSDTLIIVGEK